MITIAGDYRRKNWRFSQKHTYVMVKILHNLALFLVKNAKFFADFFGENIFKIITSVPELASLQLVKFRF
jgi:hypothetical protein